MIPDTVAVGVEQGPSYVSQFLIWRTDGEWFELPKEGFGEILRPIFCAVSRQLVRRGVHAIEASGCEISFSFEEPGIQVVFESGEISEGAAEELVSEIAANIAAATRTEE